MKMTNIIKNIKNKNMFYVLAGANDSVIRINEEYVAKNIKSNVYFNFFPGFQNVEYFKIFVLFVFIFAISVLLFFLAYFFSLSTVKDSEKLSQYECGFEPFDEATRHPFDVHFYVVGILFLIFDVEIALLFPWVLALKSTGWFSFLSMCIFLIILTIGFFYEWHRGALLWPKDQMLREEQDEIAYKLEKKVSGETDSYVNTDLIEDKEYDAEVNNSFDVTGKIDPDSIVPNLEDNEIDAEYTDVNNKINGLSLNPELNSEEDSEHPGKEQVLWHLSGYTWTRIPSKYLPKGYKLYLPWEDIEKTEK